jgi:hypothetical protein
MTRAAKLSERIIGRIYVCIDFPCNCFADPRRFPHRGIPIRSWWIPTKNRTGRGKPIPRVGWEDIPASEGNPFYEAASFATTRI